ncbi:MAG: 5-methylcytosine restriction system specificity protein McrC [Pseudonocardiaceae bacterium]
MNRLWEAVVSRLSAEVSAQMGAAPVEPGRLSSIKAEETGHPRRSLRLDALISLPTQSGEQVLLPVDAKYKSYDRESISAADTHQLLTYATAYRTGTRGSTALLVYPASGGRHGPALACARPGGGPRECGHRRCRRPRLTRRRRSRDRTGCRRCDGPTLVQHRISPSGG